MASAFVPAQLTSIPHHYEKNWIGPSPYTYRVFNTSVLEGGKTIAGNLTLWDLGTQPLPSFHVLTAEQFYGISPYTVFPMNTRYSGGPNDFRYDNKTHGYVASFSFTTEIEGAYYVVIVPPLRIDASLDLIEWKAMQPSWVTSTFQLGVILGVLAAVLWLYVILGEQRSRAKPTFID
jgi:hypothetical protein